MSRHSRGTVDSNFHEEIPKPKAKETVSLDPNPNSYPSKLPYPERMKVRGHDKPSAQHSRFLKMFKQLRLEIGLKDALCGRKCAKVNNELDRTSALADSGASINLLPHSIYKKLGLEALTPTRMTLELANHDLIPPGVEDADSEDEVNESPNLDHQDDPSIPRPPPEPPDIKKCFEPKAGILIIKEFKGVSKSHDFMTSILPTLVSDLPFISSIVSFENEDTIFDPGISI
ncbi:reverse transcriptase domain-containing protein [Tanacetum coccineum]